MINALFALMSLLFLCAMVELTMRAATKLLTIVNKFEPADVMPPGAWFDESYERNHK